MRIAKLHTSALSIQSFGALDILYSKSPYKHLALWKIFQISTSWSQVMIAALLKAQ